MLPAWPRTRYLALGETLPLPAVGQSPLHAVKLLHDNHRCQCTAEQ